MKIFIFVLVFFSTLFAPAGDKVGNGGGLWMCAPNDQIQQAILVDFYEAENEFGLTLPSIPSSDPFQIIDRIELSLKKNLPGYILSWSEILKDVKSRLHFSNSELVIIEDSLFRIRPLGKLCSSGWNYVQFANYTNYNQVLIREDLWKSDLIEAKHKAGLIWHEVIYRWMRENFGDKDSVRARQIIGLIFSNLSAQQLQQNIQDIILPQQPPPGQEIWICMISNRLNYKYFHNYGNNQLQAKNQTIDSCQNDDPSAAIHCDGHGVQCDSFTSATSKFTCAIKNNLNGKNFTESGRSKLESEAKARKACADAGQAVHCSRDVICN